MAITDPLVLPPDVLLLPVAELPAAVRGRLAGEPGDWAITRPGLRTPSRIVDAGAAELLAELRSPSTLVDAVRRYSRERGADPAATLSAAYPLLAELFNSGFLVLEGEAALLPSLPPGAEVAGFRVLASVQSFEDTEVYSARGSDGEGPFAAVKIERRPGAGKRRFEREAAILRHLGEVVAPRLLAAGELGGRRYLVSEWFPGTPVTVATAELPSGGAERLSLCGAVLATYSRLHERGVLHGDVHPGNVLVAADGEVRLIDFGFARWEGVRPGGRGGVAFFYPPEHAAAVAAAASPPDLSAVGEQHAVAALLYLLLTGTHYRDFSLEKKAMLRQVAEEPPLPFTARGLPAWPEVEAVLARALAKEPGERFPSLAAMAVAWERIAPPATPPVVPIAGRPRALPGAAAALLRRVLERLAPRSAELALAVARPLAAPRASLHSGAAGIAYALYRIALAREDAALLSAADLWAARASSEAGEAAFYDGSELTAETVGRVSPYFAAAGPPAVQAMIAQALGEPVALGRALEDFVRAARLPCASRDLTLGRSGLLLAAALLLGRLPAALDALPLRKLGEELLAGLWAELEAQPSLRDFAERPNLGIAHGWAGCLYATLCWCRVAASPLPESVAPRLAELAGRAEPEGRGWRWRWYGGEEEGRRSRDAGSMPGWCNGSAGFVHLFTLAHQALGDPRYTALAQGAAWNAWESADGNGNLCCGLAGRAYALLNLHRHAGGAGGTGGAVWLARARELAERAAADLSWAAESPDSLYRGELGLAVLAADLARPEGAAMPFFEDEGWPLPAEDPKPSAMLVSP